MRSIRGLLYVEAILAALLALASLIVPGWLIQFMTGAPGDELSRALLRFYGASTLPLVYVMWRALQNGSHEALKPVVQAYLIADVLHLAAIGLLGGAVGRWTGGLIVLLAVTIFYLGLRIYALVRPDVWTHLHPAAASRKRD